MDLICTASVIKGNQELPGYACGVVLDQMAAPSHEATYETNSFIVHYLVMGAAPFAGFNADCVFTPQPETKYSSLKNPIIKNSIKKGC